uniref:PDZ domain-containing protein n=1 Tax=Anopheles maculatus TaxID=74869 RepID=A0A182T1L5_9DIPT
MSAPVSVIISARMLTEGLFLRALLCHGVGVYISRIEEGSVAERAGLRPGDTILEVNGTPFTSINHEEALKFLDCSLVVSVLLQYNNNFPIKLLRPNALEKC